MKIYEKEKLVAFFGSEDFYSNFYNNKVKFYNMLFYNNETLFMYLKAKFFKDYGAMDNLLHTFSPLEAKRIGRRIQGYNDNAWNKVRYDVMLIAVFYKLQSNPHIKEHYDNLIKEGYSFVEASSYDKIWGIGLTENNTNILDKSKWRGKNLLGEVYNNVHKLKEEDIKIMMSEIFK